MQVKLLGTLQLLDDDISLRISGEKLRAIIGVLALNPNRPVSRAELIDELWGENLPRDAENSLHGHIARLRRTIAVHTGRRSPKDLIETSYSGYVINVSESDVDALRFYDLVRRAEGLCTLRPDSAVVLLSEALDLWHGPALMDAGSGMICRMACTRLTETRLTTYERLFDAQLELGMHRSIVVALEQLSAQYPLRERFCEQLMTALFGSGRQAEALNVYRRTWHRLTEDFGLEPGEALRAKFHEILRRDPVPS